MFTVSVASGAFVQAYVGNGLESKHGNTEVVRIHVHASGRDCTGVAISSKYVITSLECVALDKAILAKKYSSSETIMMTTSSDQEVFLQHPFLKDENSTSKLEEADLKIIEDQGMVLLEVVAEEIEGLDIRMIAAQAPALDFYKDSCRMVGFGVLDPDAAVFRGWRIKRAGFVRLSVANDDEIEIKSVAKSERKALIFDDPSGDHVFATEGDEGGLIYCVNNNNLTYLVGIISSPSSLIGEKRITKAFPLYRSDVRKVLEKLRN